MKIVFSSSHAPRLVGRGNRRDQRGMTTLGLIILIAFVGIFVMAGIRLTPVYLNYMKVAGVVNGVRGVRRAKCDVRNYSELDYSPF